MHCSTPKCDRHNEHSLESIKKTNLQFRCAFEACCTDLTCYQYAGCVTYEAEGRVHLPASRFVWKGVRNSGAMKGDRMMPGVSQQ